MIGKAILGAFELVMGVTFIVGSIRFFLMESSEVGRIVAEGSGADTLKWIMLACGIAFLSCGIDELLGIRRKLRSSVM